MILDYDHLDYSKSSYKASTPQSTLFSSHQQNTIINKSMAFSKLLIIIAVLTIIALSAASYSLNIAAYIYDTTPSSDVSSALSTSPIRSLSEMSNVKYGVFLRMTTTTNVNETAATYTPVTTLKPTRAPAVKETGKVTKTPLSNVNAGQTDKPTQLPTAFPSKSPTDTPTLRPSSSPTIPTESPIKEPTSSPTPWICPNQAFDQCGGRGWKEENCCTDGTSCKKIHAGLSLCWPNEKLLPCTYAPTASPTSKEQFSAYIEKQAEALSIESNTITQPSLILVIISFLIVFASFLFVIRQRRRKMMQKKRKGSKGSIFRPDVQMKKVNYTEGTPMPKGGDNNKTLLGPSTIPPVDLEMAKRFEKEFGISKNIAKRTRWSIGKHLEFMQKHSAIRAGAEYIMPANEIKIITTFRSIGKESTHKGLFAGAPVAIKEITLNDDVAAASSLSLNETLKYRQQKQLSPSIGRSDEDLFNSFLIDFQMMKYLQHPNIVQLLGISSLDSKNRRLLLITELCEYSLRQVMASDSLRKLLNIPSILYIARSVAVACNFIHSKGVVHFNLKPENILFNDDITAVKISDLGLSQINYKREAFLSGTDSRGLPVYVAPELINDPQHKASQQKIRVGSEEKSLNQSQPDSRTPRESNYTASPRIGADGMNLNDPNDLEADDGREGITSSSEVDVYSFGFILWEMFHAPYPCCPLEWDAYKVVIQTKFNNWRPRIDPQLPEVISTIITRCWDADPQKRPTMKQIITMIDLADVQLGYDSDEEEEEEEEVVQDGEQAGSREGNDDNTNDSIVKIDINRNHPHCEAKAATATSGVHEPNVSTMAPTITVLAPGEITLGSSLSGAGASAKPPLPPRKTSGVIITSMLPMKKKKQKGGKLKLSQAHRASYSEEL